MIWLKSALSWLGLVILGIAHSKAAETAVKSVKLAMDKLPEGFLQYAFWVAANAVDKNLSGSEKFDFVYKSLVTNYPELGDNLIRWTIETVVMVVKDAQE